MTTASSPASSSLPSTHLEWMADGACHGRTEVFFAPHAERPQARVRREAQARLICQGCDQLERCRDHARMHREYGFWGGESEEDRARAGYSVPWPIGVSRRRSSAAASASKDLAATG